MRPQGPELSREEKLQLRKEKKQQKKKKRNEKGTAAELPEPGTAADPAQPRGEGRPRGETRAALRYGTAGWERPSGRVGPQGVP